MSDQEGAPGGEEGVETMLQRVIDLTRIMTDAVGSGDFERTMALMREREQVLVRASALGRKGVQGNEGPLLAVIQEENGRLMSALREKRTSIVRQLEGVQRERAITAYRH
jgi:hypothetical protein